MAVHATSAGLRWTGHALVDVGIAGLCAFAKKGSPEDLTLEDLDAASAWMEARYYSGALGTYLSCVFPNASPVQTTQKSIDSTRPRFVQQYLRAHRAEVDPEVLGLRCAFGGGAATSPLDRRQLPLFSGEGVFNFRPHGEAFVPAAGAIVVALMFLPMASRRSEGGLLAVHADDPSLTLRFARLYLEDNQRLLALALPAARAITHPGFVREQPSWDAAKKRYKFADAKGPRSLVIHDLTAIAAEALPNDARPHPSALTAYLLSNSGQGPSLEIFNVPSGVVAFVAQASAAPTAHAWKAIASRFWPVSGQDDDADAGSPAKKTKRKKDIAPVAGRAGWTRNPAFEDLVAIFDAGFTDRSAAAKWLKRHVLVRIERAKGPTSYGDANSRSWKLAELFLKEVLGMNAGRIKVIREFADKLAAWIHRKTDKKLYRALTFDPLSDLQHALRRVQRESVTGDLLFGLDEYRDVWLHDDGDRYLVRDLICIRVVERLHELGYFKAHPEDVPEADHSQNTESTEAAPS